MGESNESPPTDLMIRHAFEFPWTRRKRLRAWQEWTRQHWDRTPTTSAAAETTVQGILEEPEGETHERSESEAGQQAAVGSKQASEAVATASRAREAAELLDDPDPALLVRALRAEARALQLAGDRAGAVGRYARIVSLMEDPGTRDRLQDPVAAQAVADAFVALGGETKALLTSPRPDPADPPRPDPGALPRRDPGALFRDVPRSEAVLAPRSDPADPPGIGGSGYPRPSSGETGAYEASGYPRPSSGEPTEGQVRPGMTVTVRFEGDDDEVTFLLASLEVPDAPIDVYSPRSPLGSAILGKKEGDTATYSLPNGRSATVEILDVVPYPGLQSTETGENHIASGSSHRTRK